jgi:hypothetical protein
MREGIVPMKFEIVSVESGIVPMESGRVLKQRGINDRLFNIN